MRLFKHNSYLLPRRPYDIFESPFAKRKRVVKPKEEEEVQIENSDELGSLPVSETREDEKMSEEATTPRHLCQGQACTSNPSALLLWLWKRIMNKKIKPAPKSLLAMERKVRST